MNSEIPNVLKLSPVNVVKVDKQIESRVSSKPKEEAGAVVRSSVFSNEVKGSKRDSKEENTNESNISLEQVKKAVDEGNSLLQVVKRNLQFKVDEATDEMVVKIVDSETGDVVRQIPSEEMLAFIKRMQDLDGLQGAVLQDRA